MNGAEHGYLVTLNHLRHLYYHAKSNILLFEYAEVARTEEGPFVHDLLLKVFIAPSNGQITGAVAQLNELIGSGLVNVKLPLVEPVNTTTTVECGTLQLVNDNPEFIVETARKLLLVLVHIGHKPETDEQYGGDDSYPDQKLAFSILKRLLIPTPLEDSMYCRQLP